MPRRRSALYNDKDVAMLYPLFALLAEPLNLGWTSLKTGWQSLVIEPSGLVIPNEPSTLKLAFAGAVTLSVYGLVTGYRRRRREDNAALDVEPAGRSLPQTKQGQRDAA
jgi:hypothetical protein